MARLSSEFQNAINIVSGMACLCDFKDAKGNKVPNQQWMIKVLKEELEKVSFFTLESFKMHFKRFNFNGTS